MPDEKIISALYGDDVRRHEESITFELRRAGIEPSFVPGGEMPAAQVPAWVSAGGTGVVSYVLVAAGQSDDAAAIMARLLRICQACGAFSPDDRDECSQCGAAWIDGTAE